ncbi:MAG: hypothetical protein IPK57_22225 [Chitinophagaceae bacterium]|nr:hypothetical protein [Chitinophagaceae bacterium]
MNINRHNYEECFILYMDNELSSDERRMVEEFIQHHPDLKEELEILQQFKLTPDTDIIFEGKEELLKGQENPSLHLSNYEEYLLLYTDNELNTAQKTMVEQFVKENPSIKKEMELLQRTKFQPEHIVFTHKESLYRREEKVKALPVRWWRAAAAILILGLSLTTALLFNNKKAPEPAEMAKTTGNEEKNVPAGHQNKENTIAVVEEVKVPGNNPEEKNNSTGYAPDNKQSNTQIAVKNKNSRAENPIPRNIIVPVKNNESLIADNLTGTNNLPKPESNPYVNSDLPRTEIAGNIPKEKNTLHPSLTNPVVTNRTTSPSDFVQASNTISDEDVNDAGGKKNKLRGLFRKVTRTFEKRTNIDPTDDDNRLLVGGLAIRLK